jgi:hypothetical protein
VGVWLCAVVVGAAVEGAAVAGGAVEGAVVGRVVTATVVAFDGRVVVAAAVVAVVATGTPLVAVVALWLWVVVVGAAAVVGGAGVATVIRGRPRRPDGFGSPRRSMMAPDEGDVRPPRTTRSNPTSMVTAMPARIVSEIDRRTAHAPSTPARQTCRLGPM